MKGGPTMYCTSKGSMILRIYASNVFVTIVQCGEDVHPRFINTDFEV